MILLVSIAPTSSNLNFGVQLAMGAALVLGMALARRKQFRAHAICQSAVVLLNLIPIATFMLPIFWRGVLPQLPGTLGDSFYAVSTGHAALGIVAEILGLYIIVRAGTNLLPQALRFNNYKRWMRTELVLWWLTIGLGVATYGVWYTGGSSAASTRPPAPAQTATSPKLAAEASPQSVTVTVSNFAFEPKELTVEAGTTVIWKNTAGRHTVTADDKAFESPIMKAGEEYRHTFEREGRFPYYCALHGSAGGQNMAGTITVSPRRKP